ncbi:hypothetical protein HOLleu_32649 [Holothuria leucospilota]|uniref:Reverse transcriptase domain-containing protein n=1 Tax=Holothuria leucospilota TaxID=206669 RepID=A0A9Q1GXG2_HOLLE|nr:hypothetical protein HOLleu_32649 [Holothuria leucospilota]
MATFRLLGGKPPSFPSLSRSGFRRGRSTTDQLVRLESTVRDGFVRGNHVVSVFFDLEKAYDTTWKYGILRDLHCAVVPQTKFLGLILDSKLNFKAHIDHLRRKCQGALNLLKVVSKMDWGADRPVLLRLYRSLVRSKLDYGCVVYSSARESYLRRLLPIHNQGLKICLGAFRTSPMQSLYIEANEPPLHIRWKKLSLQFALKLRSHRHNPTFETAFNHKFSDIYMKKPSAIPPFAIRVGGAFSQVCTNPDSVAQLTFSITPPWKLVQPVIDLSLSRELSLATPWFETASKEHNE